NPIFFVGMVWAGIAFWRTRPRDLRLIYFFSMSVPLVFAYLLQSLHAGVLPNWIAPAVVPLSFLMVLYWAPYGQRLRVRRSFQTALVLGLLTMIVLTDTDLINSVTGNHLPMSVNPLRRVRGWREMARIADEARQDILKEGRSA